MINVFKAEDNGKWKTSSGVPYTVKAINAGDKAKFPEKTGWRPTLDLALAVKAK